MTARLAGLIATSGSRRTGTIAAGASSEVNRDHAPDQPDGVGGHHSQGRARSPPDGQIP
jgi:hypothetical protein